METLTADPAPAEQPAPAGAPEQAPQPSGAEPARTCARCGAPMAAGQDWCLQCGTGAPGALAGSGWRPAATVLVAVLVLALGAAVAAYAALSKGAKHPRVLTTVARVAAPVPATPATPPATSAPALAPTAPKSALPPAHLKVPAIPLQTVTPKAAPAPTVPAVKPHKAASQPTGTSTTPAASSESEVPGSGEGGQSAAIMLDTNAATTYNPYALPASNFGDPSLAIDGDPSTAWTAQVEAATAPRMAEGLLIDMKAPQRLSALALVSTTPGMTIQIYGANGSTVPTSITDPHWVKLTHSTVTHERHLRLTLKESSHAFRYVTLWISQAPASSVGTAQAPGHVSVNEVELFPAR